MPCISELRGQHSGQDVFVIGSGASLAFYDRSFFNDRVTICVNWSVTFIDAPSYCVAKEPSARLHGYCQRHGIKLVTCRERCGKPGGQPNDHTDGAYLFHPRANASADRASTNTLERSASSITSALHLAAYLGARSVILVGHDCGTIDGHWHLDGYDTKDACTPPGRYLDWLKRRDIEKDTRRVKNNITTIWGVPVVSLLPWVNAGCEGHSYRHY